MARAVLLMPWQRHRALTAVGGRGRVGRTELPMEVRPALLAADVVVPHTDADGLAAGAMVLRERGEGSGAARLFGRGANPWRVPFDGMPALLDWGVRAFDGPAVM